jgi:membrane associated rhomboid family serine protease
LTEKQKIKQSLVVPLFFVLIIWSVKIMEISLETSFAEYGLYPLTMRGLLGIITAPLIHSDFKHLLNNTVPFLIFAIALFYFYRPISYRVFLWNYLMTGIWVWVGAREAYHIGASGVVYGLASFLVFSGIIRRIPELAATSLIVIFLYGSMIWGIFPFVPDISWESHLSGGFAGFILSIVFRKEGPQPRKIEWEDESEIDDSESINIQEKSTN